MTRLAFSLLISSLAALPAFAHDHKKEVVPAAEQEREAVEALDGPTETTGVGVEVLGAIDLQKVQELSGKQVRVRLLTIAPGGKVAVHQHQDRPGLAQILSGVAVEYRGKKAIHHSPGSVAFEQDGDVHWWHNPFEEEVRAIVIDLITKE